MSDRDCSFASQPASQSASPSKQDSPSLHLAGSQLSLAEKVTGLNHVLSAVSTTSPASSDSPSKDPTIADSVNIHHMELLSHATLSPDLFNLGDNTDNDFIRLTYSTKIAFAFPYLLHQLLAFSARHLAFLHPSRHQHYSHLAASLQSRAISLFNDSESNSTIDKNNCVPILLFSTTLGHHLLADLLAKTPGHDDLDSFLQRFVQCAKTNNGIYNVCCSAWPLLIESEMEQILTVSANFTSRDPMGDDCNRVFDLLAHSPELEQKEQEACYQATRYLQVGFDALRTEQGVHGNNRYSMIFSWTMLITPTYITMLEKRNPQSLVVLAYYMLLLYNGRSMWQVGDVGAYLLSLLWDYLGSEWKYWIEYPPKKMKKSIA